jgi:hypothetical protein
MSTVFDCRLLDCESSLIYRRLDFYNLLFSDTYGITIGKFPILRRAQGVRSLVKRDSISYKINVLLKHRMKKGPHRSGDLFDPTTSLGEVWGYAVVAFQRGQRRQ